MINNFTLMNNCLKKAINIKYGLIFSSFQSLINTKTPKLINMMLIILNAIAGLSTGTKLAKKGTSSLPACSWGTSPGRMSYLKKLYIGMYESESNAIAGNDIAV